MRGEYSLSDIKAVTDNGNGGFGDGNGAWWIVILIVLFGWGRNGNWGGSSDSGNSVPFYQSLDTDFAALDRKIDGVYSGICDSTFSLNNTITNGFAAAQNTMTQGFAGLNTGMVQQGYENRIAVGNVGNQLAQCCCDLKAQIADNKYEMAKGFCSTNNTINTGISNLQQTMCINTRDIIDNQNANYRALHDEIVANRLEDKNAQIAMLQSQLNKAELSASQTAQNEYLVNKLRPCPIPAYPSCNPWGCNCNQCCGCGM